MDSPSAIDFELLENAIKKLMNREPFNTPVYSIGENKRLANTEHVEACDVLMLEGRFILSNESVKATLDRTLYLHCDSDLLLTRRVFKHIKLNKSIEDIVHRYQTFVKPSFIKYIERNKHDADINISEPIIDFLWKCSDQGAETADAYHSSANQNVCVVIEAINLHIVMEVKRLLGMQDGYTKRYQDFVDDESNSRKKSANLSKSKLKPKEAKTTEENKIPPMQPLE